MSADRVTEAAEDGSGTAGEPDIDAVSDTVDWLPQDLEDDLADLGELPADQHADEAEQIFRGAVTGEYGDEVGSRADRMVDFIDALPHELQNDPQDAIGMQPDAATEQVQQIWGGLLDGDQGRDVETWGQWLKQTFQHWDLGQPIESSDTGTTGTN